MTPNGQDKAAVRDPEALRDELRARHLWHQCTDEEGLLEHLKRPRSLYNGFDPTADSLTIGNLVPIMLLRHFQRAGHTPVVLQGGATGRIGDPSGKDAERSLMTEEQIEGNIAAQRTIFESLLDFDESTPNHARIVNNHDWFKEMDVYTFLRDVGKHFSVNEMLRRDAVKNRIEREEQGISYTEFSYMLLQGYDFLHLAKYFGVTLQTAGADQWGNIVSGTKLIGSTRTLHHVAATRGMYTLAQMLSSENDETGKFATRFVWAELDLMFPFTAGTDSNKLWNLAQSIERDDVHQQLLAIEQCRPATELDGFGLTAPLITKSDGTKFGKTESGAIWLSDTRPSGQPGTSAYAYAQFWLNATDDDVERYLKLFTEVPLDEIDALVAQHRAEPHKREAQRRLAREATTLLHGPDAWTRAEKAAAALFSGDVKSLDGASLREVFAEAPSSEHPRDALSAEGGVSLLDVLAETTLCSSKSEARKHLQAGAVSVNGEKASMETRLTPSDVLGGGVILLRRGKKAWHVTRWA